MAGDMCLDNRIESLPIRLTLNLRNNNTRNNRSTNSLSNRFVYILQTSDNVHPS